MAQAVYTDPNAPSKRRAAQLQQQSTQRIAERNAARAPAQGGAAGAERFTSRMASTRSTIADGLGEMRTAQQRVASARPVAPSSLTPAEVASFNNQSGGRFSQANPTAGPAVGGGREAIDAIKAQNRTAAMPRPAAPTPVASIADDLTPGPSRPFAAGERAGQAFRQAAGSKLARGTGAVGTALAVGKEGLDVARVAADERMGGADIATQAAEGTGKLATAVLGAKAGAVGGSFLGPVGTALGGAAGGVAGYVGGEKLIEKGRQLFGGNPDSPAEQLDKRPVTVADFSNVQGGFAGTTESTPAGEAAARAQRQAANDGITPVADRTGAADEVLGTFQGRPITRSASDAMAGAQSFGGPTTIAQDLTRDYRAPTGGGVSASLPSGGAEDRVADLTDSSTPAGRLYAQLLADKTPTGKRMAMQFADQYIGTGTAERGQNADLEGRTLGANADLLRGRESNAAGLEQERIRGKGRGEYMTMEDGSIGRISDGLMTPVTGADGKPVRGAKTKAATQSESVEARVKTYLENIDPQGLMDVEERRVERQKYLQQLSEELGAGVNG